MKITDSDRTLVAILATLVLIGFLSKVGDGINLAVLTPLLTLLGALGQNFRKAVQADKDHP